MYLSEPELQVGRQSMEARVGAGDYLLLLRDNTRKAEPMRAVVRRVALRQSGIRLVGQTRVGPDKLEEVGGYYGRFGSPCFVSSAAYAKGIELPSELFNAYVNSSNGEEREMIKAWALENLDALR